MTQEQEEVRCHRQKGFSPGFSRIDAERRSFCSLSDVHARIIVATHAMVRHSEFHIPASQSFDGLIYKPILSTALTLYVQHGEQVR